MYSTNSSLIYTLHS